MNKKISAILENITPGLYYWLLGIKRQKYDQRMESLSLDEIRVKDSELYLEKIGRHMNWDNPVTYTEKMQLEKIFHYDPIKTVLADKYKVREWVKERIGDSYLVPLCGEGVYDSPYDIDFSALPKSFVIKTNHGSGDAIIIRDKDTLTKKDIKKICAKMNYLLKCRFSTLGFELHYADIEPKIMIERLIECEDEDLPDYKFLCFDGKPYFCWVDKGRYHNHKRNVYNLDWELQPWNQREYGNYEGIIEKPNNFEKMIEIATNLSQGFSHVRVDLYNVDGKIYFGEMTFTNGCGFEKIIPYEADLMLGTLWNLKI